MTITNFSIWVLGIIFLVASVYPGLDPMRAIAGGLLIAVSQYFDS